MGGIIRELIELLTGAGLHCVEYYPKRLLPRLSAPMITVGVKELVCTPASVDDPALRLSRTEKYSGRLLRCAAELDAYFPYRGGGTGCPAYIEELLAALSAGLSCATVQSVSVGAVHYDPDTDCFRCTVRLALAALEYWKEGES